MSMMANIDRHPHDSSFFIRCVTGAKPFLTYYV